MNKYLLISAISLFSTMQAHAESAETYIPQNKFMAKSAATTSAFLGIGNQSFALNVPEIQVDLTPTSSGIKTTGAIYHLPAPVMASQLSWERVTGGYVARIKLTSNQAKGLRFHLVLNQEIPSIKFRIQGNQETVPSAPLDQSAIHDNNIWLPVTEGNQAELEIFVDESTPPDSVLSIDAINVIVADLSDRNTVGINAKSRGLAQKPEKDLVCWAGNKNYTALDSAAKATARIDIIIDATHSGSCTGTLLTDRKYTGTPWFATANHCLPDQATANNASFVWFYQATACNGYTTDSRAVKTGGGAQLLWTDAKLEAAFLKLNTKPPSGTALMGWQTRINVNDEVWGVHHPKGDHTMVSRGTVSNLLQNVTLDDTTHLLNTINYIDGGMEPGSSGSGLFAINNGSSYWKGTLSGGTYQMTRYSDFNSYYPNIKQWLDGHVAPTGNADIEDFYNKYPTYFGAKSGNNYVCFIEYTCQNFENGKIIAMHNTRNSMYWWDGKKWNLYR